MRVTLPSIELRSVLVSHGAACRFLKDVRPGVFGERHVHSGTDRTGVEGFNRILLGELQHLLRVLCAGVSLQARHDEPVNMETWNAHSTLPPSIGGTAPALSGVMQHCVPCTLHGRGQGGVFHHLCAQGCHNRPDSFGNRQDCIDADLRRRNRVGSKVSHQFIPSPFMNGIALYIHKRSHQPFHLIGVLPKSNQRARQPEYLTGIIR
mmetsp:Transcript_81840/g.95550  ORF Transcript_81840/g.95550 Transcript_81840/m.95550 type:complete len:207 (+) Transcript_81840:173-793(+)